MGEGSFAEKFNQRSSMFTKSCHTTHFCSTPSHRDKVLYSWEPFGWPIGPDANYCQGPLYHLSRHRKMDLIHSCMVTKKISWPKVLSLLEEDVQGDTYTKSLRKSKIIPCHLTCPRISTALHAGRPYGHHFRRWAISEKSGINVVKKSQINDRPGDIEHHPLTILRGLCLRPPGQSEPMHWRHCRSIRVSSIQDVLCIQEGANHALVNRSNCSGKIECSIEPKTVKKVGRERNWVEGEKDDNSLRNQSIEIIGDDVALNLVHNAPAVDWDANSCRHEHVGTSKSKNL